LSEVQAEALKQLRALVQEILDSPPMGARAQYAGTLEVALSNAMQSSRSIKTHNILLAQLAQYLPSSSFLTNDRTEPIQRISIDAWSNVGIPQDQLDAQAALLSKRIDQFRTNLAEAQSDKTPLQQQQKQQSRGQPVVRQPTGPLGADMGVTGYASGNYGNSNSANINDILDNDSNSSVLVSMTKWLDPWGKDAKYNEFLFEMPLSVGTPVGLAKDVTGAKANFGALADIKIRIKITVSESAIEIGQKQITEITLKEVTGGSGTIAELKYILEVISRFVREWARANSSKSTISFVSTKLSGDARDKIKGATKIILPRTYENGANIYIGYRTGYVNFAGYYQYALENVNSASCNFLNGTVKYGKIKNPNKT